MSRPLDARAVALEVLLKVERQGAYLNVALGGALETAGRVDPRDAALATELTYGVMRRRASLDAAIQAQADRPLGKLEAAVLELLRIGAYQLLFLDRIPDRAAVAATVELAKSSGHQRAAGFINAVLRSIARERSVPLPPADVDLAGHLSIRESHPRWLVEGWLEEFGRTRTEALLAAHNVPPVVQIRTRLDRISREALQARFTEAGVRTETGRFAPSALSVVEGGAPESWPGYAEGLWQVQDEAAQAVGLLARPEKALRLLDACAAPGGKSCHLLERMAPNARLLSTDVHRHKLPKIHQEAVRLGLAGALELREADMTRPLPEGAVFERVMLDVPCTGLGTLRRHPELRWRRKPGETEELLDLQSRLVDSVSKLVAPGGLMVFAVCSTAAEEGRDQVARFLESHPGFRREPTTDLPGSLTPMLTPEGDLATWTDLHGTDGFFAAALRRAN